MNLKQQLAVAEILAERAAEAAIDASLDLPDTAEEFLAKQAEAEPFFRAPLHVYRGEAYVFTRAELVELIDYALRVGRATA